ncbi:MULTISPECIES: tRNA-uridine aminocarboxypropyltransferase [unclassified Pseudomonas]|uniref:tRNA-uridine aminocarboxypropyltransferase n=1 Tax=unclassified Pseudomonas TaxID=196821 RepID=UPI000BDCC26B|nr:MULTISPECIES: tRNA-uridine aminocarboxypropyltransferase [unclassified Pseudomonas]PVZ20724.1 hypothetical protein F474_01328 [Pseudomonas sp. URIL14HWK12:I12]PVZ27790.1 hypothetical protein F470_00983 [Pseudomonas sp. URIL14HWK12:I10]PVZ38679.1 hypothetical protein F472_01328 [Pseudomonas sp. URIL14HWK12:I11]SNZ02397.1 conserved hypothetical protein [Pseudomonas sp. URIL14HWK12:I9]
MPHAVSRLRDERLALSSKPFVARGSKAPRCSRCRVVRSHCLCPWLPVPGGQAGMCLVMHDIEALKPSNTGWLIADVVKDTHAFTWSRTEVAPGLLELLADPQWQPYIVFPGEFVAAERVTEQVAPPAGKRPLFVLLDATWPEARKMFRKSPWLDRFPVLSLAPDQLSRYRLRRSKREDHFCTAEVAALCLGLAGEIHTADRLDQWLDAFSQHYLAAKYQRAIDPQDALHQHLASDQAAEGRLGQS